MEFGGTMSRAETKRIFNKRTDLRGNEITRTFPRVRVITPAKVRPVELKDCLPSEIRIKVEETIREQEAQIKGESFSVFSARDVHSAIAVLMEQVWVAGNIKDISYKVAGYLMGNYDIPMIIKASRWLLDGMRAGYSLEKTPKLKFEFSHLGC